MVWFYCPLHFLFEFFCICTKMYPIEFRNRFGVLQNFFDIDVLNPVFPWPLIIVARIIRSSVYAKYHKHPHNGFKRGDPGKYDTCLHPYATHTRPQWWYYYTDSINLFFPNKPKYTNVLGYFPYFFIFFQSFKLFCTISTLFLPNRHQT